MEEQFEPRPLLALDDLRELMQRRTSPSLLLLVGQLGAFLLVATAVVWWGQYPWRAGPLALLLAWIWNSFFCPFHECTHRTAFRSPLGNRIGAWISGIFFGMSPSVYRTYHYQHHRYTRDPEKDPELNGKNGVAPWPSGILRWTLAMGVLGIFLLKYRLLIAFAIKPRTEWPQLGPWTTQIDNPDRLVFESRVVLACWVAFLLAAVLMPPGGLWLIFAAWFTHVYQTLWLSTEHTGLPSGGSILARTRSVETTKFVQFSIWNMNYHAEHHAWPSIPWHALPATHTRVEKHLESFVPGYAALHRSVLRGNTLPCGDP